MNDAIRSLLRAVLKIGGGYLVAKGLADDDTAQVIVSGLVALFSIIWGILDRNHLAMRPRWR